eukprot:Protomagalhaensia_wolfi_Nauph_80__1446@NODE_1871_length_1295_cov_90_161624_g1462_i0_p1_GENE_NODE_1871_length_1295_cov_90_161624_g1462_i0NODE_1871_length_1295_cov_90_161624_g1462_i0_p1_ORF_typecomplete_len344_score41_58Cyclin_C/PF02984_19/5_2e03Cyclin_C/PF02984_19/9_2e07Cyclin_N/PF00134_23/0_0013Cyclin_N/PF00134_23/8e02_NODE_1871_length_1295_cov_90_161624_g1462_i01651196
MTTCPMASDAEMPDFSPLNGGLKRRKTGEVEKDEWDWAMMNRENDPRKFQFLNDQVCRLQGHFYTGNGLDDLNYSVAWFTHYRRREHFFKPWNYTLGSANTPWEKQRMRAIRDYWAAAKSYRISPVTVHLAVWILNKLLYSYTKKGTAKLSNNVFAATVAVAFRTALKFEERPEALWGIRKIWEVLPIFDTWDIDRTDQFLMKIETEALRAADDCFDVPLAVQFFDKYIGIGGWPAELTKEYTELGHFLLALSTFTSGAGHPLLNVSHSKLAAGAVVLAVKIVNGDSRRSYQFFPDRLAAFCQCTMKDLQPIIKGLSMMLRKKPEEASILGRVYPDWGDHEWQ